jgi:DNA mismatch repair ATPase MutS
LKLLVQDLNRYVAIAEEFPNDASEKIKSGGLMHDRRVARIVTPGTLIDESFMDPYAHNYMMAIHLDEVDSSASQSKHGMTLDSPDSSSVPIGLAWLDLSTGSFFTQSTTLQSLGSTLARLSPREVVLDNALEGWYKTKLSNILAEDRHLITYASPGEIQELQDWLPMLESEIPAETVTAFSNGEVKAGSLLLCYVKDRLRGLSMKLQPPVRHESRQVMTIDKNSMRSLEIKQTIRDSVFKGSLLHAIRRTVTKSGARLLSDWLSKAVTTNHATKLWLIFWNIGSPSTSLEVITSRQDLVSRFIQDEDLRDQIIILLRRSHDSQRLVQKFALNRGDPDDLLRLASTVRASEDLVDLIQAKIAEVGEESDCLSNMVKRISLEQPSKLARRIYEAIDEEGLVEQHRIEDSETGEMIALAQEIVNSEGKDEDNAALPKSAKKRKAPSIREHYGEDNEAWIMKPHASPGLRRLHSELSTLLQDRIDLTETLRTRFGASSLTLKWTPGLGHICHVKGKDARRSSGIDGGGKSNETPAVTTLSSSRTTRSFHQPEWTALGERLDRVRFLIRQEEQRVFGSLREAVVLNLVKLRRNADVLDELDITTSFARLAIQQNWTRPNVLDSSPSTAPNQAQQPVTPETIIIGGRHPTVEGGLAAQGRTFTRNDLVLGGAGKSHGRVWLITGPNMAGKSTFLRQNALISILAQVGCFVPAEHATIGIVDAVFSRVGSADNLYADQSTFMVEMLETAAILRQATSRSLVVMDEVGRGTTPTDGAAVSFAALHHLVTVNRCRALFATHFHAVADLVAQQKLRLDDAGDHGAVDMYCTDVEEDGHGGFVYVHRLRKGVNRQSHALKVARLAGLPEAAIGVARDVLKEFEGDHGQWTAYGSTTAGHKAVGEAAG